MEFAGDVDDAIINGMRYTGGPWIQRPRLKPANEARVLAGAEHARRFFMGQDDVHGALRKAARLLDEAGIAYAIVGAMALNEYGYRRVTMDVDLLLTREGLQAFKERYLGRGYVEKFPGSKGLRDTEHGVPIDVVVAGDYPGDGKPKPVCFPDPAITAIRGESLALLPIAKLVELKLASGISAPHRLRDLADVLELIRAADLREELADQLDPYVRAKYRELWTAAQTADSQD